MDKRRVQRLIKQMFNISAIGVVLMLTCCFTKEELELIYYHLKNEPIEIMNKVKSLIDNYCDHTPSDAHYEQFRWQLCGKCGVQYK
jgi:hypothetical protein